MLRKALGADPAGQGYIQTVPRQGYRFSADVRPIISRPRRVDEGKGIQHDEHAHEIVRSEISNQFNDTQRDNRFFEALANRYRAILAVGMAALGFAFWDLFLNHPSEIKLIRDLSVILLASVTIYLSGKARSTITVNNPVRLQAAFRGLVPFESCDAERFYGRDLEVSAIVNLISASQFQFGFLHGEPGCGKTSLLLAGILPSLRMQGYSVAVCNSYNNPLATVIEECRQFTQLRINTDEAVAEYLKRIAESSSSGLVIIFDRFEEFLRNLTNEDRKKELMKLLANSKDIANPQLKFLFVVRSNFLPVVIKTFDKHIPQVVSMLRNYELRNFDEGQALEVIENSMRRANWPLDRRLARRMSRDLATGGSVIPAELQILGDQLQRRRIFDLTHYRRIGGKELLNRYISEVVKLAKYQHNARIIRNIHERMALSRSQLPRKES
jgi:hypothetical protein